jgi:hypothetical protein
MLSISKTKEILGTNISQEKAEEIRSFTYELAELVLEAEIINYQSNTKIYEQQDDTKSDVGDRLGFGGGIDATGNDVEQRDKTS